MEKERQKSQQKELQQCLKLTKTTLAKLTGPFTSLDMLLKKTECSHVPALILDPLKKTHAKWEELMQECAEIVSNDGDGENSCNDIKVNIF